MTELGTTGWHAPLVIVGAGPTGLTLANICGELGVETLLIEKNQTTVEEPRAVSIDDEALRGMQLAGVVDKVLDRMASGYGSHYLSDTGVCFARVEPQDQRYGFEKRNAFHQPELEATLRETLARHPSVTSLFGHEVLDLTQDGEGVRMTVRRPDGTDVSLRADYLAACDGGRSTIRKAIDAEMVGSTFSERWLIIDIVGTANRFRHTQVHCDPRRPCISLPGPGGTRRFEVMVFDEDDEARLSAPEGLRALLASHGETDCTVRRVQGYTFHARTASHWSQGRVHLLGDAAHLTPPFAGQGMNSGLRDAVNFGWKIAEVLSGRIGPGLLDTYQVERKPHAWQMIELAMTLGRVMMPRSRVRARLVQWGFQLLGVHPGIKRYIAEMRYRPQPRFPRGFLHPDGRPSRETMVGRMFPQPIVEDPDRERRLLDEVIGKGFTVIAYDPDPVGAFAAVDLDRLAALGLRPFGLTPWRYNPPRCPIPCFRDASGMARMAPLETYQGWVLVLRPDRYVVAALPRERAAELVGLMESLFATAGPTRAVAPHLPTALDRAS
ncbi:bifunctional 3-(3-hydroxy-phenyl)propionate/3-hydroxycinnamic acid hydroxylase [Rhodospirillum sp. A1_3_36]|uniref:bifunctional 3-(3-hydroxy-phenyl)propionate/3-hydroxycinnamic acid hydroxylase n=1 Tax=Rhodospirillum sp. A1_3_36 TaxID=3391666 RepID=UPI0039A57C23